MKRCEYMIVFNVKPVSLLKGDHIIDLSAERFRAARILCIRPPKQDSSVQLPWPTLLSELLEDIET